VTSTQYIYSVGTHKFTKSITIEKCIKLKNWKKKKLVVDYWVVVKL